AEDQVVAAVSFFDPALKEVRRRVFYQWSRTVFILCVFVLAVLSIFWGSQYSTESKYRELKVWVVDFDGQTDDYATSNPVVGPVVTNTAQDFIDSSDLHLGYIIKNASTFNNDPWAVRQAVYDEHAYAAVIVNPNATALLRDAVTQRNTSYDPIGAIQTVIISARDQNTYYTYVLPDLAIFQSSVLASFGPDWVQTLITNGTNLTSVPSQAINPAIGFTNIDLRPFTPAVAAPAVTIGLIYLIIIAFFNFPFLMPIHAQLIKPSSSNPPLKIPQWLIWRICSNIAAYFFLSLFYSLVSLAFGIPFSNSPAPDTLSANNPNAYGKGSFVVFWMLNWVGMTALGMPCENMAMVLGFPWSSFFLIFWVITNVATGFYAVELASVFYRWGYAWPLHRIVEALRTILFGTHSRIGLDFAVLFIWIAVSIAFFPVASFIMRWKMKRGLA
ncbi:uncharacterized protein N7496_005452, partial [Penicillium cataractarum]